MAPDEFKRILVIHFGQLGDVVLGLPALKAIRERFPDAEITLMTGKPAAEIVGLAKVSDDVIAVDRVDLRDGNPILSIAKIFKLVGRVRSRRFDLVIDLHSLSETNLLGFLARIPRRLYANRENRSLDRLGNFRPRPAREDKARHVADRYFDVLAPLGITGPTRPFRFDASVVSQRTELEPLEGSVGIFPGAGHPSRCWNLNNFEALARNLIANGHQVAVFLGPEESGLREQIVETFPEGIKIVEGLTLTEFIGAVSGVSVFICNDTGPMHLAGCAGVPVVLLMDERAPITYLPLTYKLVTVRHGRLDEITVQEALAAIQAALRGEYDKDASA